MLGMLTTSCQLSRYVRCLAGLFVSLSNNNRKHWNRSKSKRWNRPSQAVMFLGFCLRALPLELECKRVSELECKRVSDFLAQKQFSEFKLDELALSAVHLKH